MSDFISLSNSDEQYIFLRAVCIVRAKASLMSALKQSGGPEDWDFWKKLTLEECVDYLSQSGIGFTYVDQNKRDNIKYVMVEELLSVLKEVKDSKKL